MKLRASSRTGVLAASAFLLSFVPLRADRPEDVRAQVTYVASALSNGNPSDALGPIDKSFPDYAKFRDYIIGLSQAYGVTSEVTIKDEDDREGETRLMVEWRLTLADNTTNLSTQRIGDVNLTLKPKNGKWKIVDLSPLELFNPQQARR